MTTSTTASPAATTTTPAVSVRGLRKTYGRGPTAVHALDGLDLDIERGRFTAVMGPSGSGKSTFLHCAAGLDDASAGEVRIGDTVLGDLNDDALTRLRRDRIGMIFQAFNLLPTLNARDNILLPARLGRRRVEEEWWAHVIDTLGLRDRLDHRPSELSGGQQQRVATARALLGRPDVVFADEPTGALDSVAAAEVLDLLRRSVRELGQTVVMVTHDPHAATYADRVVLLADGRLAGTLESPTVESVLSAIRGLGER